MLLGMQPNFGKGHQQSSRPSECAACTENTTDEREGVWWEGQCGDRAEPVCVAQDDASA